MFLNRQVFFSRKNPLINWDLPFFQRLWYSYAAYAPFCTIFTIPGFMVAPFISVLFGIHPLVITYQFVLAATIYFILQFMIQVRPAVTRNSNSDISLRLSRLAQGLLAGCKGARLSERQG